MTDVLIRLFIRNYNNIKDKSVRRSYGLLCGIIGIVCNFILFVLKIVIGFFAKSMSVTADAFNNLSDAGSAVVTLVGFKMASRPADKNHPFGHGRIEYISGLIVSLAIVLMGIELVKTSIEKIIEPSEIVFNQLSIILLIASITLKLWLFCFNNKVSKKIESTVMKAMAFDSLADVVITTTIVLSMLVNKFTGLYVDGYSSALVSFFIIWTGVSMSKDVIHQLIGTSPNKKLTEKIKARVLSYDKILGVNDISVHNYGPSNMVVSLRVNVPKNDSVEEVHKVIDQMEKDLKKFFKGEFIIHTDPTTN